MHIELVPQHEYQTQTGADHRHQHIWKNIKDLLKSCIGIQSNTKRLFHDDGSLIDRDRLQRNICHNDQSYKSRQLTWPYLLNIYSPSMTDSDKKTYQNQVKTRYHNLKRTWQERVSRSDQFYVTLADTILKDVRRTDRHIKSFKKKKQILFNIMMTYSVYHPNPGYSQGMTDMLTPIVYVFVDESMSYFAFCSLMNRYMNSLFDHDQIEINHRLYLFNLIFQSIDNELWNKINSIEEEETYLFVYRWLLLDCKREFYRFDDVLRVLELVWIHSISSLITNNRSLFTIFVCISILEEDRQKILSCTNEEDLHTYFFSSSSPSSSSRSHRSTKRILKRAQMYHLIYTSEQK